MEVLNLATQEKQDEILQCVQSNITIFDKSGTHSFQVPSGVYAIYVTIVGAAGGGGAGGGTNKDTNRHGDGGQAGELPSTGYYRYKILTNPNETIEVEIGDGGAGGLAVAGEDGGAGLAGGITSFGSYISVSGGSGGNGGHKDGDSCSVYHGEGNRASVIKPTLQGSFYIGFYIKSIPGEPGDFSKDAQPSSGYGTPGSGGGGAYKNKYYTPEAGSAGAKGTSGIVIIEW